MVLYKLAAGHGPHLSNSAPDNNLRAWPGICAEREIRRFHMEPTISIVDRSNQDPVRYPGVIAISAPGRASLTHEDLWLEVRGVGATLEGLGLGPEHTVALVGSQSPETAVALVALTSHAACAPLNPALRATELNLLLADLDPSAIVIEAGSSSAAREVARARGIALIEMSPGPRAGGLTLRADTRPAPRRLAPAGDALLLHTSGTTGRPKLIGSTRDNLAASCRNIAAALALDASDRGLIVMPLFHIHGIMVTLAALRAGGGIVCPGAFSAAGFLDALADHRPTWYSAVPTIHRAVLDELGRRGRGAAGGSLRLIRSSSAALAPAVAAELEAAFGVPVIEAYGMTEATHQIASNPLPPGARKPGSVGLPVGTEVAVLDEHGRRLPAGEMGEIVIRGDNVAALDADGWLRTGDLGHRDADGYVFITGRLKELINRGGEKISPREVDEVLAEHPAVAQAAAFGVPHPTLGEDLAAAVVLRSGRSARPEELRQFVAERLAAFKVPGPIHVLDELPAGSTGKVQRRALSEALGVRSAASVSMTPRDAVESEVADIWASLFPARSVGVRETFFELGGDSLLAARLFAEIERRSGRRLPLATLFEAPTVEALAEVLRRRGWEPVRSSLVAIQPLGSKRPLYCIHPHGGHVLCYRELADALGPDQPVYGLEARGLDGREAPYESIEAMAAHYVREIRAAHPHGPYALAGYCLGGTVAFEMARQLVAQGETVSLLAMFQADRRPAVSRGRRIARHRRRRAAYERDRLLRLAPAARPGYVLNRAREAVETGLGTLTRAAGSAFGARWRTATPLDLAVERVEAAATAAAGVYDPEVYPGTITLFRWSELPARHHGDPWLGWNGLAAGGIVVHEVAGHQATLLARPAVGDLAGLLARYLE